jgi:hypothetical protein
MDGIIRRRGPATSGKQEQPYWSTADHCGYLVRVRRPRHRGSTIRLAAALLFVSVAWLSVSSLDSTSSYYADSETSTGNTLAAATFNLELTGQTNPQPTLACGEQSDFSVQTDAPSSTPIQYRVYIKQRGGSDALCNALSLTADRPEDRGGMIYDGPLLSFPGTTTRALGAWAYSVELPDHRTDFAAGEHCSADIVYSAWRAETHLHTDSGYTDRERVTVQVRVASSSPQKHVVDVINDNRATVTNDVESSANTGGNTADGSYGGSGGRGGDVEQSTSTAREVRAGDGGDGGTGDPGGTVESGPATSSMRVTNRINQNRTDVSSTTSRTHDSHATGSTPRMSHSQQTLGDAGGGSREGSEHTTPDDRGSSRQDELPVHEQRVPHGVATSGHATNTGDGA